MIDVEARKIIEDQYVRAQQLLREKRTELDALAKLLLEKEVLFKDDLEVLIGKRPFDKADVIEPVAVEAENPSVSKNTDVENSSVENTEA